MLNCLRQLSTQTSIMAAPERLPEEALHAAMNGAIHTENTSLNYDVEMTDSKSI